ncbi:CotH kinase family protein [Chryseobacterium sp. KACC 21268]|nr:CotH kinase family protein [Chryseobacterium sp. KACC 21268]
MYKYLSLILIFLSTQIFASTIEIPKENYRIDKDKRLIVCNADLNKLVFDNQSIIIKIDGQDYKVLDNIKVLKKGLRYTIGVDQGYVRYSIYFTELPLLFIDTDLEIVDAPKVMSRVSLVETTGNITNSNAGIEYRGDTSQNYPKKSFEIEFWKDEKGNDTQDLSLLGLREDKDWNLQAMYNEPLKISSVASWEFWDRMSGLYYQNLEPKAKAGISMKYAEVFVNNSYQGLYAVSEKMDRKQLKLKKNTETEVRGELYKSSTYDENTQYIGVSDYNNDSKTWGGYEYTYPKDLRNWSDFYNLHFFAVFASKELFESEYKVRYDSDNLVNYFIFINTLRATDNMGKNFYTARYDKNEKYFLVPWDLDSVLGRDWISVPEDITDDFKSNGLFQRLWEDERKDGFRFDLNRRWLELRSSTISVDKIMQILMDNFNYLKDNGAYERDQIANSGSTISSEYEEFSYIREWLTKRIAFLDRSFAFNVVVPPPPVEEETIDKKSYKFQFYPNPAKNYIYFINKSGTAESSLLDIDIYTIAGRKVRSISQNPITQSVFIGNIPNGNYIMNIKSDSGIKQNFKLIIDK